MVTKECKNLKKEIFWLFVVLIVLFVCMPGLYGCSLPKEVAVEEGTFYTEQVSPTMFLIHVEGDGYSPRIEMDYVVEQLKIIDNKYKIVDVVFSTWQQWIWSPVIVIVDGEK